MRGLAALAAQLEGRSHLGGTTFCVQNTPEDLTPCYLETEEFGGGDVQLDLISDTVDWACG
ncbi:hypothetical protein [Nocardia acidivorans]|uniref:hypothetical protein n=1 Tax=Nocardia acidivorans TaxID=404580 RepID=UPI000829573E|nr:hypothetical protein [Nocardia acidivorans]